MRRAVLIRQPIFAALLVLAGPAVAAAPERATLLQLSVADPDELGHAARLAAFTAETTTLHSCEQALASTGRLHRRGLTGELTVKSGVPLASLPPALGAALASQPLGSPTPVFRAPGFLRVLLRCEASFRIPVGPGGVQPVPAPPTDPIQS